MNKGLNKSYLEFQKQFQLSLKTRRGSWSHFFKASHEPLLDVSGGTAICLFKDITCNIFAVKCLETTLVIFF